MKSETQNKGLMLLIVLAIFLSTMDALVRAEEEEEPLICKTHKDSETIRLEVAAHGYDVWRADPFADVSGDPGQRDRIFDVQCINEDLQGGYYEYFTAYPDYSCKKRFTAQTYKNYKDYSAAISSASEYSNSFSIERSGGAYGVSLSASAKYKKSGNTEQAKTRRLFEEKQGEVRIATAYCKTYDARLNTDWLRPKFSSNFIRAVERLEQTLTKSTSTQQAVMKRFVDSFGTHIMTETDFGAKMIYEKRFTSRSKSAKESNTRKSCVRESLSGCVGGGYTGASKRLVQASAKTCLGSKEGKCNNAQFDENWGEENGLSSTTLRTIGSGLTEREEWGMREDFKPVPIRRKLKLISSLFTAHNLKKSETYGFRKSLDHQGLRKLFDTLASQYCTLLLGRSSQECSEELSGCGLNDNCGFDQECINDKTSPSGYVCEGKYWKASFGENCPLGKIVDSVDKCREAATYLGIPYKSKSDGNEKPAGCYYKSQTVRPKIYFNTVTDPNLTSPHHNENRGGVCINAVPCEYLSDCPSGFKGCYNGYCGDSCAGFSGYESKCNEPDWSGSNVCMLHAYTNGDTCATYCENQGSICTRAQENSYGCNRDVTQSEGCNEKWDDQICVCKSKV